MANDVFADIASKGIGGRMHLLHEPAPVPHKKNQCFLSNTSEKETPFKLDKKSYTRDELFIELETEKRKMEPFLKNLAPEIKPITNRTYIDKFILNGKEEVTIPHYGAPIGYNLYTYEAEFETDKKDDKAYYICFDGADYIAVVYINDVCVGTHEGFFSPFEFHITNNVKSGKNKLKIELYNDYIYGGNAFAGDEKAEGDKLYAATGPGWDDAAEGWHHCPAGTGLYNKVYFEERSKIHLTDIFVRPLPEEEKAEIWVEVNNATYVTTDIEIKFSIFGQNFNETVVTDKLYVPETTKTVGMGDSLTEAIVKDILGKGIPMPVKNGKNIYKIPVEIKNPRLWELDTPYLYQAQISVLVDGEVTDTKAQQFGMRSFTQDVTSEKKGMFYLNGRKTRLRGANTMGYEQQDVMNGDFEQLIDDILLAKLCNMNFLRITQRPVQDEIYTYCDRLGLMIQTDLPLFGCMRRTKFAEGVRQAEEMERMVRKHPCCIVDTYINEPFPNANNEPHRHLTRDELEQFFTACDIVIKLQNPDRVIKHVDGDYDPPTESMPDNHCYPMWYNGHGIDIGKLHKGYWIPVRPNWYYGCGEYGAEGLDSIDVMQEYYPKEWLKEPFSPANIVRAQTGHFHRFFYDTQDTMEDWVRESHEFQAFATKMMTEAFRRDNNLISNAIHLFIDAWPSGWMKTIMDCKRIPKKAFFAYRDALLPLMISLRTDRFTYTAGEEISIECFVCNDTNKENNNFSIAYELYNKDGIVLSGKAPAVVKNSTNEYSSEAVFTIDSVNDREVFTLRAVLLDENNQPVCENSVNIEVFEDVDVPENDNVIIINPEIGTHTIAGETVTVKECGMLPLHFASRKTGHESVAEFKPKDFSYWYNKEADMITPILTKTFTADGFTPILISGNKNSDNKWVPVLACAEKEFEGKKYIICTVDLRTENPIAKRFLKNLLS